MKLERRTYANGIAMTGVFEGSVRFGFTERTGGVSQPPYASLNLGSHVVDDPAAVRENRFRVLEALGARKDADRLLVPNQVHGDHIACVQDSSPEALARVREEIAHGADGIICTVPHVPIMLCFADCVPVVITSPHAVAVVHSGWKGTYAGIAGKAARMLMELTGCAATELAAFVGPHILGDEYEVSEELMDRFHERFGEVCTAGDRLLDLAACIRVSLVQAGMATEAVCDPQLSTMKLNDRFYSYRAEHGSCGRHAAVAVVGERAR